MKRKKITKSTAATNVQEKLRDTLLSIKIKEMVQYFGE